MGPIGLQVGLDLSLKFWVDMGLEPISYRILKNSNYHNKFNLKIIRKFPFYYLSFLSSK